MRASLLRIVMMKTMYKNRTFTWSGVVTFLAALLIWKVTLSIVIEYRNYFPPDFGADFLRGRESYFRGAYGWAFYAHLVSGPVSLILGTLLVSDRIRRTVPVWHRRIGRFQAFWVLLLVVPSGLWMSFYAETGFVAATGLGSLAITTAACVAQGWRTAVMRRFDDHRRWMLRTFLLLCSAVVIRLIGGLATVVHFDAMWLYPFSAWVSWLVPLLVYESSRFFKLPIERAATPI